MINSDTNSTQEQQRIKRILERGGHVSMREAVPSDHWKHSEIVVKAVCNSGHLPLLTFPTVWITDSSISPDCIISWTVVAVGPSSVISAAEYP